MDFRAQDGRSKPSLAAMEEVFMWRAPDSDPARLPLLGGISSRTLLIGTALFLVPPTGAAPSPGQLAMTFVLIALRSYGDVLDGRGDWPRAMLEGFLRPFPGTRWTAAPSLAFGSSGQPPG